MPGGVCGATGANNCSAKDEMGYCNYCQHCPIAPSCVVCPKCGNRDFRKETGRIRGGTPCDECDGRGYQLGLVTCRDCRGLGSYANEVPRHKCMHCNGEGRGGWRGVVAGRCLRCGGSGGRQEVEETDTRTGEHWWRPETWEWEERSEGDLWREWQELNEQRKR